jgi:hypothetical protein
MPIITGSFPLNSQKESVYETYKMVLCPDRADKKCLLKKEKKDSFRNGEAVYLLRNAAGVPLLPGKEKQAKLIQDINQW